jgi:hypothetical protein
MTSPPWNFGRTPTPIIQFLSRPLTAGIVVPSLAQMGGTGPSGSGTWKRMGANISIQQVRGGVPFGPTYQSGDAGFGFLGGGNYNNYSLSGMGPMTLLSGDQILLSVNTYAELVHDPVQQADDGFRIPFSWGAVPGPLTTTRFYASGNVAEL